MGARAESAGETRPEKLRLGGMALSNGVLVHGPTSWACAVRTDDGRLKVVAERKRIIGSGIQSPLLRGPARLAEAFAFLPHLKRALPEARLPFERGPVLGSMLAGTVLVNIVRRTQLGDGAKEMLAGLVALAPAVLSLREGSLAAYHGAEHIAIGSYEHDERAREGARAVRLAPGRPAAGRDRGGNLLAARAPVRLRSAARVAATLGAVASATEVFGWMQRHPDRPLARALARPGPRAPASGRDRRAVGGAARGRRGSPPGMSRARRVAGALDPGPRCRERRCMPLLAGFAARRRAIARPGPDARAFI